MAEAPLSFDEIRPYYDSELPEVLERVLSKPSFFHMMNALFPEMKKADIVHTIQNIKNINDFQATIIRDTIRAIIRKTTTSFEVTGLENLDPDKAYLFLSNHRDIILDSAFLNLYIHEQGFSTSLIGIGDNLMVSRLVTDLMKVNKSFIIHRSTPRTQVWAYADRLSRFISTMIQEEGQSVWLAQRNGRTKDGIDMTQASVLKMLLMAAGDSVSEHLQNLQIVPIAVSYEYEPCDHLKAEELTHKTLKLPYEKDDKQSMLLGITEPKGRIHIGIGRPLSEDIGALSVEGKKNDWIQEVGKLIDSHIQQLFKLWPVHFIAFDLLRETDVYKATYTDEEKADFEAYMAKRLKGLKGDPETLKQHFLQIYAGPIIVKEKDIAKGSPQ